MDEKEMRKRFGYGKTGEPVPEVDLEDLKAVWELGRGMEVRLRGQGYAFGVGILQAACKPGANIPAVTFRGSMLGMVRHVAPDALKPWTKDNQLDDVVFRAIAEVPMEWLGVGIVRKGLPFDVEDFMRRVREAA